MADPKLPEPATGAMKVVAWRVSSDRSAVSSVTDNGARVAGLKKYPHTVIEDLVLLSDAQALAGEVERLRADAERYRALRPKICIAGGKFHILNLSPTYVAPDAAIELDAALDASRALATQEAKS